jgi:hypothetical protein
MEETHALDMAPGRRMQHDERVTARTLISQPS